MINEANAPIKFSKLKPTLLWLEMSLPTLQQNVLLSISMGMTKHSHHYHLTAILSPIYTGAQKRKLRLPTPPIQKIKDKLKAHISKHRRRGDANTNSA